MCVYACIKRLCRHVKDPVVHVILQWIMGTHRYCMHIRSSVNVHCTKACVKKLVTWRERKDNPWLTTKFGTFSNWPNRHWSTQWHNLSLLTMVLFLVLLLFCCRSFFTNTVVLSLECNPNTCILAHVETETTNHDSSYSFLYSVNQLLHY